jgi:transcription antitermination factor NusG
MTSELVVPGEAAALFWYAVYTKHQHERTATEYLTARGFEVLFPSYRVGHRWKDRRKIVELPLFPCYAFVRTALSRKIEILKTPGVFWLVEQCGRPCAIPETEIETVRKLMNSSAHVEPHPFLKCGDLVMVRTGALAGVQGILTRIKNRYRVVLSVNLLQKSVAVEVDLAEVERQSTAAAGGAAGAPR